MCVLGKGVTRGAWADGKMNLLWFGGTTRS